MPVRLLYLIMVRVFGWLRLLAAEGMVSLGTLSLDGTRLAGRAAQKANRTLPQIEKVLAEAAAADVAGDARHGCGPQPAAPRTLARRAERRERLARARDRLAAEDKARRGAQPPPTESCPRQQPGRSSSGPAVPGGLHGDHSRCPSTSRTKTGLHRPAMRLRCTCHRPQSPVIRGQPTQQCSLGLLGSGLAAGGCWGPRPGGFGAWQGRPGAAASSGEIASDPE